MAGSYTIVTGGNRGIGYHLCKRLLTKGHSVILAARDPQAGQDALQKLRDSGDLRYMQLDMSDPLSIQRFVDRIAEELPGRIGALVNNAGILPLEWTREAFDRCLSTNVAGPVMLTEQLLPHMQQGGTVVMVSSGLGKRFRQCPDTWSSIDRCSSLAALLTCATFQEGSTWAQGAYAPVYCTSKAMLNKAVRLLAEHPRMAAKGLCVTAVCPGWCRTDMGGPGAERSAEQGAFSVLWSLEHAGPGSHGGFFRDGVAMEW